MWLRLITLKVFLVAAAAGGYVFYDTALGEERDLVPETFLTPEYYLTAEQPAVSVKSFAIFDANSGEIITSQKGELVLPIASITKIFTAAVVLNSGEESEKVTITEADVAAIGRAGRLAAGQVYTTYDLVFPLLLESSNDAAAAIDRVLTGGVVARVRTMLDKFGAAKTKIVDSSGLADQNQSSAHELAYLAAALRREEPHLFDITKLSRRVTAEVVWTNNSPLQHDAYLGGKHGFTEAAQRTAVVFYKETLTGGISREIGYVVLGSEDLASDVSRLRDFVETAVVYQ